MLVEDVKLNMKNYEIDELKLISKELLNYIITEAKLSGIMSYAYTKENIEDYESNESIEASIKNLEEHPIHQDWGTVIEFYQLDDDALFNEYNSLSKDTQIELERYAKCIANDTDNYYRIKVLNSFIK